MKAKSIYKQRELQKKMKIYQFKEAVKSGSMSAEKANLAILKDINKENNKIIESSRFGLEMKNLIRTIHKSNSCSLMKSQNLKVEQYLESKPPSPSKNKFINFHETDRKVKFVDPF